MEVWPVWWAVEVPVSDLHLWGTEREIQNHCWGLLVWLKALESSCVISVWAWWWGWSCPPLGRSLFSPWKRSLGSTWREGWLRELIEKSNWVDSRCHTESLCRSLPWECSPPEGLICRCLSWTQWRKGPGPCACRPCDELEFHYVCIPCMGHTLEAPLKNTNLHFKAGSWEWVEVGQTWRSEISWRMSLELSGRESIGASSSFISLKSKDKGTRIRWTILIERSLLLLLKW